MPGGVIAAFPVAPETFDAGGDFAGRDHRRRAGHVPVRVRAADVRGERGGSDAAHEPERGDRSEDDDEGTGRRRVRRMPAFWMPM